MPLLLEAMSSIISCHAYFVSPDTGKATTIGGGGGRGLLLVVGGGRNLDELPGSSITLSIVFGLLSAILGGGREVRNTSFVTSGGILRKNTQILTL